MNEIKISVDLNVQLSESTKEFINKAISTLLGAATTTTTTAPTSSPAPAAPKTEKPAPTQTARAQAADAPKTEKPATVAAPAAQASAAKTELTINDVRSIVASKAATHRNEIKSKLAELGAQNVTTLDPSNYQVFVDYLNSLN